MVNRLTDMLCDYRIMGNTVFQHRAAIGAFMDRLRGPGRSKRSKMKSRSKEQRATSLLSSLMSCALGKKGRDTLLCILLLLISFKSALGVILAGPTYLQILVKCIF